MAGAMRDYRARGSVRLGPGQTLRLSPDQVRVRADQLAPVGEGRRPKVFTTLAPIELKAGEVFGLPEAPDALPRALADLVVPLAEAAVGGAASGTGSGPTAGTDPAGSGDPTGGGAGGGDPAGGADPTAGAG